MNKVIIITRDDKSYYNSRLSGTNNKTECLYPHYDMFCNRCEGQVFDNTMVKKCIDHSVARKVADFGKLEPLSFSNSKCFITSISNIEVDTKEKPCYGSIQSDGNDVTLFYINRTIRKKVEIGALPQFLYVICHDCGIDLNDDVVEEKNILYIHDTEWGVKGEFVLMKNQEITSEAESDKITLLEKLKKKFSYVATFQHIDRYGGIFHDILNGKFGGTPLAIQLGEIENNGKCTCFEELLYSCESVLEKTEQ